MNNKNTGDGELREMFNKLLSANESAVIANNLTDEFYKDFKALIAQEANKAQQQLLQELMEKFQNWKLDTPQQLLGVDVDLPEAEAYTRGSNTVIKEIVSVIQNKLKGLS